MFLNFFYSIACTNQQCTFHVFKQHTFSLNIMTWGFTHIKYVVLINWYAMLCSLLLDSPFDQLWAISNFFLTLKKKSCKVSLQVVSCKYLFSVCVLFFVYVFWCTKFFILIPHLFSFSFIVCALCFKKSFNTSCS